MTTTPPTITVALGTTTGATVELAVPADELKLWPRERYEALMEAIGRLTDVVTRPQDFGDARDQEILHMVEVATGGETVGASAADLQAFDAEARENERTGTTPSGGQRRQRRWPPW